jgi:MFS transporter, ACS family, tartrate transporter
MIAAGYEDCDDVDALRADPALKIAVGRHSDERCERKVHLASALVLAAAGIAGSTLTASPALTVAAFTIGACGVFAAPPLFWTLPTAVLSGTAAAAGIAVINSIGNLSGFVGPYAMGWIKDNTGSFSGGLLLIAALAVIAAALVLVLGHALEKAPADRSSQKNRYSCPQCRM